MPGLLERLKFRNALADLFLLASKLVLPGGKLLLPGGELLELLLRGGNLLLLDREVFYAAPQGTDVL